MLKPQSAVSFTSIFKGKKNKMAKQIQIPDIGSDEVTVTEVMVKVGETITADQSIINVEGDKASWKFLHLKRAW